MVGTVAGGSDSGQTLSTRQQQRGLYPGNTAASRAVQLAAGQSRQRVEQTKGVVLRSAESWRRRNRPQVRPAGCL
jgi:hypothetical protein